MKGFIFHRIENAVMNVFKFFFCNRNSFQPEAIIANTTGPDVRISKINAEDAAPALPD